MCLFSHVYEQNKMTCRLILFHPVTFYPEYVGLAVQITVSYQIKTHSFLLFLMKLFVTAI